MKKTLIAAGIAAVVAAPAFADVKISGAVEQAFTATENGNFTGSSDNNIAVSASEDLGNGLTAFAKIMLDVDNGATNNKDEIVGIKSGFGTVVVGRMEDFTRSKISSKMTFVNAGGAGGEALEAELADADTYNSGGDNGAGADRQNGAIAYISPTVNGLHVGVASYEDVATDIAVFYDNGPLSLAVSREEAKRTTSAFKDHTTTAMAASYTMGDIKATVVRVKTEDASDAATTSDATDMAYRLDYKMGNNTISLGYVDNEDNDTDHSNDTKDVMAVELVHAFSKSTNVAASWTSRDEAGSTADVDTFTVGLSHKF